MRKQPVQARGREAMNRLSDLHDDAVVCYRGCACGRANDQPIRLAEDHARDRLQPREPANGRELTNRFAVERCGLSL